MDLDKLQEILKEIGEPAYRFKQIKLAICRDLKESFDSIENIPQELRQNLGKLLKFDELILKTENKSADGTLKRLFLTKDNLAIESVLIKHQDKRRTVCVSTEAGCQINCSFCATGHLGFQRVLTFLNKYYLLPGKLKLKKKKLPTWFLWEWGSPFSTMIMLKKPFYF
jgi:23S rRNA (adenine2503-C2)-methyltransferase